jgi:hypothetical protein
MEVSGTSTAQYTPERLNVIKATCLTVALALGDDICRDEIVIVGGLVPALLYGAGADPVLGAHVGTNDLDLALDLVILDRERYEQIRELLLRAGFKPDESQEGALIRQRWRHAEANSTVDFLMPLSQEADLSSRGKLQHLTADFAAIKMLGLDLALQNKVMIEMGGRDLQNRQVTRRVPVCAPHVFVMLKAIAMKNRDKQKDAYDLYYVLRHADGGASGLGQRLRDFEEHAAFGEMIASLQRDFETVDSRGPMDVCAFLGETGSDDLAADVLANVQDLMRSLQPIDGQ